MFVEPQTAKTPRSGKKGSFGRVVGIPKIGMSSLVSSECGNSPRSCARFSAAERRKGILQPRGSAGFYEEYSVRNSRNLCRPTSAWVGNEMRGLGEDKRVSPCSGFLGIDRNHIMKRDSPIVCGEREETVTPLRRSNEIYFVCLSVKTCHVTLKGHLHLSMIAAANHSQPTAAPWRH